MGTELAPRIEVDPEVHGGRPVVQGTRVPVDVVLGHLAAGATYDDVADAYDLEKVDILAVLQYAADTLASEVVRPAS